jgi:GT2 family glycosyltransferase
MTDTNKSISISVVLPNYNGEILLANNLPSLIKALGDYDHEIIVVDDNSSDNSVHFLENNYPNIIIIHSEVNQGFSSTCNKGINIASKELVCIANTDVTFTEDYFKNAASCFTEPDLFAVKGDIINYRENFEDVINIERTSLLYYKRGFLRFNQKIEPANEPLSSEINAQFVLLGCCFVCRREALQNLKGYDEIYSPFYWEDADLAQRALKHGYQLKYNKDCKVYHQLSATISSHRSNRQRRLISNRNKILFTWRHLNGTMNWVSHILFMSLNLISRWLTLDWKFYMAFFMATHLIMTKP